MKHIAFGITSNLLILLYLVILPAPGAAFDLRVNFDSTPPAQFEANNPAAPSYVPTTLPGASGNAYKCIIQAGRADDYCGLNVYTNQTPLTNDVYARYYIKFSTDWQFDGNFKSLIFEGDVNGGRAFINLNAITPNSATMQVLIPGHLDQWFDTGVTVRNDGKWHCIEARQYRNIGSPANGRFTVWHNGTQVLDINPANCGFGNLGWVTIGYRNANTGASAMTIQYEEVVVADHYIGPIRGNIPPFGAISPSPPGNLQVQP